MNKWSRGTRVLPGRVQTTLSVNVRFISDVEKKRNTWNVVKILKRRGALFAAVYRTNTYFQGTSLKGTAD